MFRTFLQFVVCLMVLTLFAPAIFAQGKSDNDRSLPLIVPDAVIDFKSAAGSQARRVESLRVCKDGACRAVDPGSVYIASRDRGGETEAAVEVCHDGPNPFIQVCDVYDCYSDAAGQQSVCVFQYKYNRNCLSDGC